MSKPVFLVLVVDRDATFFDEVRKALDGLPVEVLRAENCSDAAARYRGRLIIAALLEISLHDPAVPLHDLLACDPAIDVLLTSGTAYPVSASAAIARGATEILTKPFDPHHLRQLISESIEQAEIRHRISRLDDELLDAYQFEGIVGRSPAIRQSLSRIRRVAPFFESALITGASGTGKQLLAHTLHKLSPRSAGEFVACDCRILTSALEDRPLVRRNGETTPLAQLEQNLLERADGGTLFIDEIGELPLPAQAKLSRALQNPEFYRLGSHAAQKLGMHVVASTTRDLRALVEDGKFREDLFSRLATIEIHLPPLADRKEDLPLLQRYFLRQFSAQQGNSIRGISQRAQLMLSQYSWPGNISELQDVIASACSVARSEVLDEDDFPESLREQAIQPQAVDRGMVTLEEVEARHLKYVLSRVHGNKARAAEILGISRASIYAMLARMRHTGAKNALGA